MKGSFCIGFVMIVTQEEPLCKRTDCCICYRGYHSIFDAARIAGPPENREWAAVAAAGIADCAKRRALL